MKKLIIPILILTSLLLSILPTSVSASSNTKIVLSDEGTTVDGTAISTDTSKSVYSSTSMNNGGTSDTAVSSNIKIDNIININSAGTYEFTGNLSNGQISINANSINGEVRIILNDVQITCENAPAIFVYSKDPESENCKVVIETYEGTTNKITGGKIKQSVEGWEDQDSILYYVEKDYDDEKQYYERYKYDGAISSDVSLTFEGAGTLNVVSSKKEGIESKMDITINSGTYNILSLDDGINACMDNKSTITINGGTVLVNVLDEADEGDGIDSNGYLYINGGTVYAFAHPGSDNGLDSDLGTYINGGTVFTTGSMYEETKTTNDTKIIQMQLKDQIEVGQSIVIVDENENVVFAYKADRNISTLVYSSSNLTDQDYTVYAGNSIEGKLDSNNIYTEITSLDLQSMTKQENSSGKGGPMRLNNGFQEKSTEITKSNELEPNTKIAKMILIFLIILIIAIAVTAVIAVVKRK